MEDIVTAIDRVLAHSGPRPDDGENPASVHVECPRNILQYAKEEILRLRSLAGPIAITPTASEIYHGLRRASPVADAEGA